MGITRRLNIVLGAAALAVMGRDRLYMAAQRDGWLSSLAQSFAGDPDTEWLTRNWKHRQSDGFKRRLNEATIAHYGTDDLGGWALEQQPWGDMHNPLEDQIRGLIFPELERRIEEGAAKVIEIGSSNGDVLARFARKYPDVEFVGVDFVTPKADIHDAPNLTFRKGYALDLLETGELSGDVLFASSTFCLPGPVELEAYCSLIAKSGFRTVLILDPVTRAYSPDKYPGRSMHQTFGMWGHDYRHYFGQHGYRASEFRILEYTKHRKSKLLKYQIVRLDR